MNSTPVQILPVRTAAERRAFLAFPWRIYKGDPLWVPPLLTERRKVIDPKRGAFFRRGGRAEFFIAWRGGQPVGTICAADDTSQNKLRGLRDCMFGFFECIDDYAVAEALFDCAAAWAGEHQLETLYGPFNLDYEDGYGILIEGRDRPPVILCGHTPPYYLGFVERYGFLPTRGDNLAFEFRFENSLPQIARLERLAERVGRRQRVTIRSANLEDWDNEIDRLLELINRSQAHLSDNNPWQRQTLHDSLGPFRLVVDPELVLFAEIDGQVVGWFPGIPNVNEAIIQANGLRYPWDYLRLLRAMRRRPQCLAIKAVMVLPEYWDTGVSVLLFAEMARRVRAKGYTWVDLSLTSDDNPDTPVLAGHAGAKVYKRYRVFRKRLG
jgi:hypothetical protein